MSSDFQLPERIRDKIEKLLTLADPANGATLEEANNASAKVQDILAKYNLELSQLSFGKKETQDMIAYVGCWEKWLGKNDGLWVKHLLNSIANLNGVCLINHSGGVLKHQQKFTLVGKKHAIEICLFQLDSLVNRVKILQRKAFATYGGHIKAGQFKRSFFEGALMAIMTRLEAQMVQTKSETPEYGVMLRSDFAKAQDKMMELFPAIKSSKSSAGSKGVDARAIGYREGSNVGLQSGVPGSRSSNLLN